MADSWLWTEVHHIFDTDDGTLPEIRITYPEPDATVAAYALLRERAERVVNENPQFWSITENASRSLDSVPNAAALVVSGTAEAFHLLLGGIELHGATIPDLGVFVLPPEIALDFRMGADWGPAEVEALFELLAELTDLDPRASPQLANGCHEDRARLHRAWERWSGERTG